MHAVFDTRATQSTRQNPARRWQPARRAGNDDVSAAADGGRAGLIEDHFTDPQQRRHNTDAEPEPTREHQRAYGMRQQRAECQPENHPDTPSRSMRPSRMTSVRAARSAM